VPFAEAYGGGGFPWLVGIVHAGDAQQRQHGAGHGPAAHPGRHRRDPPPRKSEEQKETYLLKMVSGEWTGTMNLTEPDAGSDVGALRTKAVQAGRRQLPDQRPEDLHHLR
jgi:alkylation response protein AidB-like acyl-CoA dehydrogenase